MYSDLRKKHTWVLIPVLLLALVLVAFALQNRGRDLSGDSAMAIRDAIRREALQCYAVEGVYPPTLSYLEENYGLSVNTEDFYITYEAFASNLPPEIKVTPKVQKGGGQ